ncbi:hypothetical protein HPG69_005762 [Diceros bicornis minor]|uniref:Uncharacterized protein n=1 Tax=Diceros bicornis minor TaxID=77932 RepID=A0A7J7ETD9_DICBM|nr:hypothetical protein HPG69_005762 [Diceros bicornis minor]
MSEKRNQIHNETQRVQAEFKQMRGILDCEEQKELLKLKKEETGILHNVVEAEKELVQCGTLVAGVNKEDITVDGMLKPVTAFWNIVLSANKRQRFLMCIHVIFLLWTSWVTNVSPQEYIIGKHMCLGRLPGSWGYRVKQVISIEGRFLRYRPHYGYWVKGLQNESKYNAYEDSSTSDPQVLTLSMAVPSHCIWIFLDCEAGTGSFFNVTNHGVTYLQSLELSNSQDTVPTELLNFLFPSPTSASVLVLVLIFCT